MSRASPSEAKRYGAAHPDEIVDFDAAEIVLITSTQRKSDHIFTYFDVPMTPVLVEQAHASGWAKRRFAQGGF
jgi:hypothetical protein